MSNKILLVEDNKPEMVKKLIERQSSNIEVEIISTVTDLQEKLKDILNWTYKIILLDENLYDENTNVLLQQLLTNDVDTPILSVAWTPWQSAKFGIPWVTKDFGVRDRDTDVSWINDGTWSKKREEEKNKRKDLLEILNVKQ